jgi:CRP-like cAMP-binding protein
MPSRVAATVDIVRKCPLYKPGDRLTFAPPAVSTDGQTLLCGIAVQGLWKSVDRVLRGEPPARYARTYCGGCPGSKAWFSFALLKDEATATRTDAEAVAEMLGALPLFSGIAPAALASSARLWETVSYPGRSELLRKGEPGQAFLVILEGTVDVIQHDEAGGENLLASLQRGDCLGEMSLITGNPVSATARARNGVTALRVSRELFPQLLAAIPALSFKLAKILAHRLARTGAWISDELKKGVLGKFEVLSPFELVQSMSVNAQSGTLTVRNADIEGTLYFENGQVYEFRIGGREDLEAFFDFLRWQHGTFRLEPGRRGETIRRVKSDTMGLLLEGMRRIDESATPPAKA